VNASAAQRTQRRFPTAVATLLLVLGTETVLFGTLLEAYLYMRAANPSWPGVSLTPSRMMVPATAMLVLLASEFALWRGRNAARDDTRSSGLRKWLAIGLGLGLLFLGGQTIEFAGSGMTPGDAGFGGVFFTLMAFHGLHVLAGLLLLGFNYVRAGWGDFDAHEHVAIDVGFYFWTYVVAVWLVMFIALYLA
jgi:heme/copper-type cytochrome/quinol oxidase subunit 3